VVAALLAAAMVEVAANAQESPLAPTVDPAVQSATAAPVAENSAALAAHDLTKQDLEIFFDGAIPLVLAQGDMAGAVISIVKDGELLFAKGYGYADLKTRKPVLPDQTLFRPGSVSKLFTWTAVMQMVEQGKLDLDRDVNEYIDFRIPEKFGAPITMRQLMTHTAGFEEAITDLFVEKPEQLYPLRDYLVKQLPERIFPPGKIVAYSNYGTTLAGHIVERLSGEAFDAYIANHILKPLGMENSTMSQPLPPALAAKMSTGYRAASNENTVPFELVQSAPAGSLTSSATDMARFMLAHLNKGRLGEAQILKPETADLMHGSSYQAVPGMNGYNLGFYDGNRNGRRIIDHGGDTLAFHSDLHLILDANVGFFISFNSGGKEGASGRARTMLFRAFLDRYFPYDAPEEATVDEAKFDAQRVAGSYTFSRRKESAMQLLWALSQTTVAAQEDGTIKVSLLVDFAGNPKTWRQVGPLKYREVGGPAHLAFVADESSGRILHFTTDDFVPVFLFQRTPDLQQTSLVVPAAASALAVIALTVLIWIAGWLTRWRHGAPLTMTAGQSAFRLASRFGAVLLLVVVFGWLGLIVALSDTSFLLSGRAASWMTVLYWTSAAAIVGALAIVLNAGRRVMNGPGGVLVRGGELLLAAAAIYGIWAIVTYGLVSFITKI
jgi:CubicO group peptidase (beta-lactamase class C family)